MPSLAISIVSHGQGDLVRPLLEDLSNLNFLGFDSVEIILTINIPEDEVFIASYIGKLTVFRNLRPAGFGANHNRAFSYCGAEFFMVLNPDVRITKSFSEYILREKNDGWGCMAPLVYSEHGELEDSARYYPSIANLIKRVLFSRRDLDYRLDQLVCCLEVDWVAGICMIFRRDIFKKLKGFDDRYFMYLEDADICRRMNIEGCSVLVNPSFSVIHSARRKSLKDAAHFRWHLRSIVRFVFGF